MINFSIVASQNNTSILNKYLNLLSYNLTYYIFSIPFRAVNVKIVVSKSEKSFGAYPTYDATVSSEEKASTLSQCSLSGLR